MTRRRDAYRLPEALADAVGDQLDRLGGAPQGSVGIAAVTQVWEAAVGATIARHAWPSRIRRDGTLVVHASSSTWAFELTHLEETVRGRLGEAAPAKMAFVVGPLPEGGAESRAGAEQDRSPPTPSDAAEGAALAAAISDLELRETVARAAAASLAAARRREDPTGPSDTMEIR